MDLGLPLSPRLESNRTSKKWDGGLCTQVVVAGRNVKVKQDIAPPTVAIVLSAEGKTNLGSFHV